MKKATINRQSADFVALYLSKLSREDQNLRPEEANQLREVSSALLQMSEDSRIVITGEDE